MNDKEVPSFLIMSINVNKGHTNLVCKYPMLYQDAVRKLNTMEEHRNTKLILAEILL